MEWQQYARELIDVLNLKGSPIAVSYVPDVAVDPNGEPSRVCDAFQKARDGAVVDLTPETSACKGGSYYLGFAEPPASGESVALNDYIVNVEKLYRSCAAFFRASALVPQPPTGLAECVRMAPLEETKTPPDLVIFICNAEQACRLVTLDQYETGIPPRIMMSGSTCYQTVAFPLVTGETNVSLMDYSTRRCPDYSENDLLVSIPYNRMHALMRAIPFCTAGRAEITIPRASRGIVDSPSNEAP